MLASNNETKLDRQRDEPQDSCAFFAARLANAFLTAGLDAF